MKNRDLKFIRNSLKVNMTDANCTLEYIEEKARLIAA
jgi:hypothetical protein